MKIDWIEGISIIGIGVVIWYIVDQTKKGRSKMKLGKAPQSPADCPKGTRFDTFGTCLAMDCPPPPPNKCTPIYKGKRESKESMKIRQVGSWTPNDTSCTPCTTMAYQGGRGTARIHKSWCDINCSAEVKRANKLRNPFPFSLFK